MKTYAFGAKYGRLNEVLCEIIGALHDSYKHISSWVFFGELTKFILQLSAETYLICSSIKCGTTLLIIYKKKCTCIYND